jgi:hypothetical protein
MNIGKMLREEISRVARREVKVQIAGLRRTSAAQRALIAALRRQFEELRKATKRASRVQPSSAPVAGPDARAPRFSPQALGAMRARLGLSAAALGLLVDASEQSVWNWLHGTVPRREFLDRLAELRSVGKREAHARLEKLSSKTPRPRK